MEKQLLDRYREMVHGLYEEAVRDIIAGTFDNIGDIKLGPRQNQNKSNTPKKKKKKKKLSGIKNILLFFKKQG